MEEENMLEELLLMNDNAIAALVFLRETENPYDVFCKYITYCLDFNKCTTYDELDSRIRNTFGLNLPFSLCQKCMEILASDGTVERIQENHFLKGYKLIVDSCNKDDVLKNINIAKEKEKALLDDMVQYINQTYNKQWDINFARKELIRYLNYNDAAISMFLCDNIILDDTDIELGDNISLDDVNDESLKVDRDSKLIQKYLHYISSNDSEYLKYFNDVIHGLMLLNGIAYSEHLNSSGDSTLNDVLFFFDTKLILRYLGFTTKVYKDAVEELIDLIKNKYKGKVCLFRRTFDEVSSVLSSVYHQAKNNNIKDLEMSMYYYDNKDKIPYIADNFRWLSGEATLKKALIIDGDFELVENTNWNNEDKWAYNIDTLDLRNFIRENKPKWNRDSIDVDVDSFIQMNILRNEDYSVSYGGINKLPIFVTSNYALVNCIRKYMKQMNDTDESFDWKNKNLPFISDRQLMCELWLPQFKTNNKTSQILQSLLVDAILPFDHMAYNYMREQAKKIKKQEKRNIYVNINNERQEKLTTLMIKKDISSFDDFDSESLVAFCNEAMTAEHVAEISHLKEEVSQKDRQLDLARNNIKDKDTSLQNKDKVIKQHRDQIIQSNAENFLTKMGVAKFFAILGKYWWLISTVILSIISMVINVLISKISQIITTSVLIGIGISILPVIFNCILSIVNKISSQNFVVKAIHKKCYQCAEKYYKRYINKKLPISAQNYQEDIINYCLTNCKYLNNIKD